VTIRHDVREQLLKLRAVDPPWVRSVARAGVGHLAPSGCDLMGERGRQLAIQGDPSHSSEFGPLELMVQFGLLRAVISIHDPI